MKNKVPNEGNMWEQYFWFWKHIGYQGYEDLKRIPFNFFQWCIADVPWCLDHYNECLGILISAMNFCLWKWVINVFWIHVLFWWHWCTEYITYHITNFSGIRACPLQTRQRGAPKVVWACFVDEPSAHLPQCWKGIPTWQEETQKLSTGIKKLFPTPLQQCSHDHRSQWLCNLTPYL